MLDIVDAVKQAIPDASCRPPGEALEYVGAQARQATSRSAYEARWGNGPAAANRDRFSGIATTLTRLAGLIHIQTPSGGGLVPTPDRSESSATG